MSAYAFSGAFVPELTSPDGDTIRFRPDHPHHLDALAAPLAWSHGTVQVRLDGIDAPELHYEGEKQRRSTSASIRLLTRLGFPKCARFGDAVVRCPEVRGRVVATGADPHGRVIGFAYREHDLLAPEGPITLDRSTALWSANAHMLETGAAYALFYTSQPAHVRAVLRNLALAARDARRGVWAEDASRGFVLNGIASVGKRGALVFPKLFRRCITFALEAGRVSARAFVKWLHTTRAHDDALFAHGHRAHMSTLLHATEDRVHLQADPLWMVFDPKGG